MGLSRFFCVCAALMLFTSSSVSAVEPPTMLSALLNQHQQGTGVPDARFSNLEEASLFYQRLNQQAHWPRLAGGSLLRQDDRDTEITILRQQLMLLGDYRRLTQALIDEEYFDQELSEALKQFQYRHGAKVDGILGPKSRALLNVPPSQRLNQLSLNQYRVSQFRALALGRYIQVNIPEFRLRLVDQGDTVLQLKTIVGRKKRKTPVFTTDIKALVMNPSWTVPKSIGWKDIIPAWQADPEYLSRKNLSVAQGWGNQRVLLPSSEVEPQSMYNSDEYRYFWEAPGQGNTLGRIKFLSHSRYAIYLHDTSAPGLFNRDRRDLSSGCIRVERAEDLAQHLIQLDSPEQLPQLGSTLMTEKTSEIYLRHPVPVHMTYWTAWVDNQGLLNFRDDIYRRDEWEHSQLFATSQLGSPKF